MDYSMKQDKGKLMMSLIPPEVMVAMGEVLTYGATKYDNRDETWRRVEPWRYRDALMRHLVAYLADPTSKDDESGLPHLWHMACNVAFLVAIEKAV